MVSRILIGHSTSECNRLLLQFLHKNIDVIKQHTDVKVVIIYKELQSKLKGTGIRETPVLITSDGQAITKKKRIVQYFKNMVRGNQGGGRRAGGTSKSGRSRLTDGAPDELADYWNQEMHSGENELCDEDHQNKQVEEMKRRASVQSREHQQRMNKSSQPRRPPSKVDSFEDNEKLQGIELQSPEDMESDPDMKRFWANQEETPM
jgi:hypothetical protein